MLAFVSFDLGHDELAFGKFVEGSSGCATTLRVEHWSLKPPSGGPEWPKLRKDRISRSDLLIVLVGDDTATAEEIRLARASNVPFFGIYLDQAGPTAALPSGLPANRTISCDWQRIPA